MEGLTPIKSRGYLKYIKNCITLKIRYMTTRDKSYTAMEEQSMNRIIKFSVVIIIMCSYYKH